MISKRNLSYIGSVLAIVLFSAGITVMAAGLSQLPSVPSNTTQTTSATLPGSTVAPTETEPTAVLATDATTSATVPATVVTILDTTSSATTTPPSVDVIAQSTATSPNNGGDDEDDNDDNDDRPIDPSIQLISKDGAAAIALARVGGGSVIEIELHRNDNPPLYDIKLIYGGYKYELKVHAVTGALLDLEKERIESSDDSADD